MQVESRGNVQYTAREIAIELSNGRPRKTGKGYLISCPCSDHPDQHPSCSIWDDDRGYIAINCNSRCGSKAPREALIAMGLIEPPQKKKAPFDKKQCNRTHRADYVYHTADGAPYQINRRFDLYDPKTGDRVDKDVLQFRADGKTKIGSGWEPVLYNLPGVIAAAKEGRVIIATEGEGKADLLLEIDRSPEPRLAATTHSGGCKNTAGWLASKPWEYARGCAYWAQLEDNDEPGHDFATWACYQLHTHGIPAKRIALPGLGLRRKNKGLDIADWMPGHTLEELLELIDTAPLWTPEDEEDKPLLHRLIGIEQPVVPTIDPNLRRNCLTESFAADHFKKLHEGKLIFVPQKPEGDKWHFYDGRRYATDTSRQVRAMVEEANKLLPQAIQEFRPEPKEAEKFLTKSLNRAGISNTLYLAEHRMSVNAHELDSDVYLLNTLNGTVNLKTGARHNHTQKDMITKLVHAEFNPKAKCPRFLEFLKRLFDGDQELINFDQRYTGYCLSGDIMDQSLVFGYGPRGNNGKSTHAKIKLACAGDYGRDVLASMFILKKIAGDIHSESLDRLVGYRLVSVGEIPQGAKLNDQLIKDLTSGKKVEARPFGAKPYSFMPQCHLLFESNYKPSAVTDEAFWRRILYLPYLTYFAKGERNKYFAEEVWEAEIEGILWHYIQGAICYFADGPMVPQVVTDYTESVKYENDPVKQFAESCLAWLKDETPGKFRTLLAELHLYYEAYREAEGFEHTHSPTTLKRELERLGFAVTREKKGTPLYVEDVLIKETAPKPKDRKRNGSRTDL